MLNPKDIISYIEKDKTEKTDDSLKAVIDIAAEFFMWDFVSALKDKAKKENKRKAHQAAKNALKKRDLPIDVTVSACIIGRDRAAGLERCLESIKDKVDEIIYIDTGSKDNSAEIAKRYGAIVDYFQWCDDFSAARNYSIRFASKKWVLIVDTDEEIEGDIKAAIRESYKAGSDALCFKMYDIRDGKKGGEIATGIRAMRRKYIEFELPVHNQLINWATKRVADGVVFYHYGYEMSSEERKKRTEQTQRIALKYLETHDSAFMSFNVAVTYMMQLNYGEAIEWFKKSVEMKEGLTPDYYRQSLVYLVKIYSMLNKMTEMLTAAAELEKTGPSLEMYYDVAAYFYNRHMHAEALKYFERYIEVYDSVQVSEMYVTALDKKNIVENVIDYCKGVIEWESTREAGRQSSKM